MKRIFFLFNNLICIVHSLRITVTPTFFLTVITLNINLPFEELVKIFM